MKRDQLFEKGDLFKDYSIIILIEIDHFSEKYRVSKDGSNFLLSIFFLEKAPESSFQIDDVLDDISSSNNFNDFLNLIEYGEDSLQDVRFKFTLTPYVSGETLFDKIEREGSLNQEAAVTFATNILTIIRTLHCRERVLIHNSINLRNIYIDYSENIDKVFLGGFQSVRYTNSKISMEYLNDSDLFYLPPEIEESIYSEQSDIFSVGAILYNILVGCPPWFVELPKDINNFLTKFHLVLNARNKNLKFSNLSIHSATKNINIEPHIVNSIQKALSSNPNNRFKNVDEFIRSLNGEASLFEEDHYDSESLKSKNTKIGFSAIAGMKNLKEVLFNDVIRALREKELYKSYGLTIPNGILLYGPPGCGKTFFAEKLAEEISFNFIQLKPSDLKSKWVNDTEQKIAEVFDDAIENSPSIIFIDEFDAVVPSRERDLPFMNASAVNELLTHMSNCSEKGIFIIAASNRPEKIDSAILRTGRIDKIIYLPPPDYNARLEMFKIYLHDRPTSSDIRYEDLSSSTENFVSSDIKFIIDEASRSSLKSKSKITHASIAIAIESNRPSISKRELDRYEGLKNYFNNY